MSSLVELGGRTARFGPEAAQIGTGPQAAQNGRCDRWAGARPPRGDPPRRAAVPALRRRRRRARWRRSPRSRPTPGYDPSLLHRRYDRLTGAWVLVSPARNVRPSTTTTGEGAPPCPLCPGGPELPGPFGLAVFENRYPSMSPHAPDPVGVDAELVRSSLGRCLVVVYTAEHVEHLAELSLQQFANVVAVWRERTAALWAEGHDYVMAFENHGSDVGATLPHLHGQLYAYGHLPPVTAHEARQPRAATAATHGDCLGCRLVAEDLDSERVIHANEHFVAAVPFASRWPLEVHVRARHHGIGRLGDLDDDAALDLVRALSDVVRRYDRLWGFPLPYMMCVQEAPPLALRRGQRRLAPPRRAAPAAPQPAPPEGPGQRRDGARHVHQRHAARAGRRRAAGRRRRRPRLVRCHRPGGRGNSNTRVGLTR